MNNRQESKLRMFRETDLVLDNNKPLVNQIEAMIFEAAALKTNIHKIDELHPKQSIDGKGVTIFKNSEREDIAENACVLAGALFSMGTHKNDADLCQRMNVNLTLLSRASLADFNRITTEILNECKKAEKELLSYGIKPEDISAFTDKLKNFKTTSTLPRNVRVDKSTATMNLEELFSACDNCLVNHLDNMILVFKHSHPDFYKAYTRARIIEDRGSRQSKKKSITAV